MNTKIFLLQILKVFPWNERLTFQMNKIMHISAKLCSKQDASSLLPLGFPGRWQPVPQRTRLLPVLSRAPDRGHPAVPHSPPGLLRIPAQANKVRIPLTPLVKVRWPDATATHEPRADSQGKPPAPGEQWKPKGTGGTALLCEKALDQNHRNTACKQLSASAEAGQDWWQR